MRFRRNRLPCILIVACAAATACDRTQPPPAGASASPVREALPDSGACVAFAERGVAFDSRTREDLRAELGPPVEMQARSAAGYGASEDSLFLVRYEGMLVSMHKPQGGAEIIDGVRITDNRWLRYPQVGIGVAEADAVAQLGEPSARDDGQLTWVCHSHPARDDPFTLRVVDGRVVEVIYTFFMD